MPAGTGTVVGAVAAVAGGCDDGGVGVVVVLTPGAICTCVGMGAVGAVAVVVVEEACWSSSQSLSELIMVNMSSSSSSARRHTFGDSSVL